MDYLMGNYKMKMLRELLEPTEKYKKNKKFFSAQVLQSPLGDLLAVADNKHLYMLQCIDFNNNINDNIDRLTSLTNRYIVEGRTPPIDQIEDELNDYFYGELMEFQTPIKLIGSRKQLEVWRELQSIPWGEQRTFTAQAIRTGYLGNRMINFMKIVVANPLVIIVPCHRLERKNGKLGLYSSGIERKKMLLALEGKQLELNYD